MAIKIANRVKMTVASVASSGTEDITLGTSVPGYLTFAEGGVSNADTTPYVLEAANGDWEIGTGTYTSSGTVLARTTVTKSLIGGVVGTSKITASSTSIVMISPLAADMQSTDTLTSGTLGVARGGTGTATLTGILKGNGASAFTAATAGTDYVAPGGALGTPSSGTLTNCTGYTVGNLSGAGTGVVTALGNATNGASGLVTLNASSQLPAVDGSSLTTLNASNISSGTLAVARGGSGATATTGSGNNVLATSPVLATPAIIGSSTGKTTIASANSSASDYTLTLPAKTGNIITSADSGTVTQAMLASNVAGNGPSFSAYAGSQTLTAGVNTLLQLSSVDWNSTTGNCFNNTGSTTTQNSLSVPQYSFCPNVAGYYMVTASIAPASSATPMLILLYKNGSNFKQFANSNSATVSQASGAVFVYLNGTGDYIQLYGQFVSTGQAVSGAGTFMQAALVRAG